VRGLTFRPNFPKGSEQSPLRQPACEQKSSPATLSKPPPPPRPQVRPRTWGHLGALKRVLLTLIAVSASYYYSSTLLLLFLPPSSY
jgi:hypothetical protein